MTRTGATIEARLKAGTTVEERVMPNRRQFVGTLAGAAAMYTLGRMSPVSAQRGRGGAAAGAASQTPPARRQVTIDGRRIRVVDVHAHCAVPEVGPVVKGTKCESQGGAGGNRALGPARIELIDR